MALSVEKIEKLTSPDAGLSCDFSVLVQCSANLESAQGAAFGVPNPFLGLVGFALVVCVGVALWAVPHFARWFWMLFNIGVAGAFAFVVWSSEERRVGTECVSTGRSGGWRMH